MIMRWYAVREALSVHFACANTEIHFVSFLFLFYQNFFFFEKYVRMAWRCVRACEGPQIRLSHSKCVRVGKSELLQPARPTFQGGFRACQQSQVVLNMPYEEQ